MLDTYVFGSLLKEAGFDFYSGVPCSFLKDLINYAINDCEYVMAANEGDAVAISSGAYLGGRKSVVLMQNSGLTNATSPLTSLNFCFKIPILGFVSLRGEPGLNDEPQHELMGTITTQMLDVMQIPWEFLSADMDEAAKQIARANDFINKNQIFFFVVKKGTFSNVKLAPKELNATTNNYHFKNIKEDTFPTRLSALEVINKQKDNDTIVLATTGHTGRELYEIEDAPNNLYMVGSMGCISTLGLGLALARPDKKVIVIDGDGSILMRLGAIPTIGFYSPNNLIHILLDNNSHDSTGGQATISHNVDFDSIAAACGFTSVVYTHSAAELEKHLCDWKNLPMLTFLYLKVAQGSKNPLGRPKIKPYEVKDRLLQFIHKK